MWSAEAESANLLASSCLMPTSTMDSDRFQVDHDELAREGGSGTQMHRAQFVDDNDMAVRDQLRLLRRSQLWSSEGSTTAALPSPENQHWAAGTRHAQRKPKLHTYVLANPRMRTHVDLIGAGHWNFSKPPTPWGSRANLSS